MICKKIGVLVVFGVFFLALFSVLVSAENCEVRLRTDCQASPWNNIVMGLFNFTNAHAQLWDSATYDYVLCCDFNRLHDCNGANKIIALSDTTNAHAEIPDAGSPQYTGYDVCYGDFDCRSTTGNCNILEIEIFSLSDTTNAHIGMFNDYSQKICCAGICNIGYEYVNGNCEATVVVYWANINNVYINNILVNVGQTSVLMIIANSALPQGTTVNFDIYEYDGIFSGYIRTITGVVDSNGNAEALWTITQTDLDIAFSSLGEGSELENFYFKVNGATSGDLNLTIVQCIGVSLCMNYQTQEECEIDACSVADISVRGNGFPDLVCGQKTLNNDLCEVWSDCECTWDQNSCIPHKIDYIEPNCPLGVEGNISLIGSCFFSEITDDDCDDGFLTYSWSGIWSWDINNIFSSNISGDGYVEDPIGSGAWHYDPDRTFQNCVGGSNSLVCPAQIQLPFFGVYGLIITIILIILIYVTLNFKKKKNTRKKSPRKRKKK